MTLCDKNGGCLESDSDIDILLKMLMKYQSLLFAATKNSYME
jgi:hypothetical protein